MNIVTVSLLGIVIALIVVSVKSVRPDFGALIGVFFGIAVMFFAMPALTDIISSFRSIAEYSGIANEVITTAVKTVGISLIAEFACSIANDAGEAGIAQKIEAAAKIIMLSLALPLIKTMLDGIFTILP